jgi:hypothetical protein
MLERALAVMAALVEDRAQAAAAAAGCTALATA